MMFQKQEEKRTRWNEIIQNKERNIENSFKHQKDLMIKQTKQDKEKAKKVKEGIANFNFKVA